MFLVKGIKESLVDTTAILNLYNSEILLNGKWQIISYQKQAISLSKKYQVINILGNNLLIEKMELSEIRITGIINKVEYLNEINKN